MHACYELLKWIPKLHKLNKSTKTGQIMEKSCVPLPGNQENESLMDLDMVGMIQEGIRNPYVDTRIDNIDGEIGNNLHLGADEETPKCFKLSEDDMVGMIHEGSLLFYFSCYRIVSYSCWCRKIINHNPLISYMA